jgi:hypothetical protein
MTVQNMLMGMGLGAGAMYFYDPELGDRRRALVRDQFACVANDMNTSLETAASDLRNRAVQSEPSGSKSLQSSWTPTGRLMAYSLGGVAMLACMLRPSLTNTLLGTLGFAAFVSAAADATRTMTQRTADVM